MARCQVLLVRQDAGVETDHDADVLAEMLVTLGGKLRSHAGKTDNERDFTFFKSCFDLFLIMCFQSFS